VTELRRLRQEVAGLQGEKKEIISKEQDRV